MTSFGSHLLLFSAVGLQLYDVSCWSFTPVLEPSKPIENPRNTRTVHFMCQADVPLVKCQFNYYYRDSIKSIFLYYLEDYEPIDLSQGSNSGVITKTKENSRNIITLFDVSYNGTGLEHGQCGATFTNVNPYLYHFGCRGADASGAWQEMDFIDKGVDLNRANGLNVTVNPRQVVALPGSEVSILVKTNASMRECGIQVEWATADIIFYCEGFIKLRRYAANYRYYGSSPQEGDCGLTFMNVTEHDNGPMLHVGWTDNGENVERISTMIVASPPTETYFNVNKLKYSVGDTLNATCSSLLSRPVANLTWTLDDRIIRQDGIDDEFQEDVWSWPWDKKNITQRMSITLEEEHFGKKLECSVQHLALTNQQSDFNYLITKV